LIIVLTDLISFSHFSFHFSLTISSSHLITLTISFSSHQPSHQPSHLIDHRTSGASLYGGMRNERVRSIIIISYLISLFTISYQYLPSHINIYHLILIFIIILTIYLLTPSTISSFTISSHHKIIEFNYYLQISFLKWLSSLITLKFVFLFFFFSFSHFYFFFSFLFSLILSDTQIIIRIRNIYWWDVMWWNFLLKWDVKNEIKIYLNFFSFSF